METGVVESCPRFVLHLTLGQDVLEVFFKIFMGCFSPSLWAAIGGQDAPVPAILGAGGRVTRNAICECRGVTAQMRAPASSAERLNAVKP